MDAPYYNGPPGDDDPEGSAADHQCPGCSARDGERCDLDCTCGHCEPEPDGTASTREEVDACEREAMDAIYRELK